MRWSVVFCCVFVLCVKCDESEENDEKGSEGKDDESKFELSITAALGETRSSLSHRTYSPPPSVGSGPVYPDLYSSDVVYPHIRSDEQIHAINTDPPPLIVHPIVQYVLLRRDLQKAPFNYSLGSIIAQACHACISVNHRYQMQPETIEYVEHYANMHKVVLQVKDEAGLLEAEELFKKNKLHHHKWTEHPENISTAIALRPYSKFRVEQIMKKFSLFR